MTREKAPVVKRIGGGHSVTPPKQISEDGFSTHRISHPSVIHVFDPYRDLHDGKPYYEDGDPSMYTPENIAKREALRTHPGVVDAIKRFSRLYSTDEDGLISKSEYVRVHTKIAQALVKDLDSDEATKIVETDWLTDCQGTDKMDYSRLFAAIFELADLWTKGTTAEEYLSFIDALHYRVQYFGSANVNAYSVMETSLTKIGKNKT